MQLRERNFYAGKQRGLQRYGRHFLLFPLLSILAVFPGGARSSGDSLFKDVKFVMPGNVRSVILEDMDADHLKDLLVFFTENQHPITERRGCIFWQISAKGFPPEPDQCWAVPSRASIMDTGDIDGTPGREIFYLTPEGVVLSSLKGRVYDSPVPLIKQNACLPISAVQELPAVDFFKDWDGDGQDEALLFNPEKALFFKRRSDGNTTLWSEIKQAPRAYLSETPPSQSLDRNFILRQSLWMPEIRSSGAGVTF